MPERRPKVLPLSKKVKGLNLIRKEKKSDAEQAETYGKTRSFIGDIVKKEKEIHTSFAVKLQKLWPQCVSGYLKWKRHSICTVRYSDRQTTFT